MKFNELHLSAELLAEIEKAGFVEASHPRADIQLAMAGKDVIGQSDRDRERQQPLASQLWRD